MVISPTHLWWYLLKDHLLYKSSSIHYKADWLAMLTCSRRIPCHWMSVHGGLGLRNVPNMTSHRVWECIEFIRFAPRFMWENSEFLPNLWEKYDFLVWCNVKPYVFRNFLGTWILKLTCVTKLRMFFWRPSRKVRQRPDGWRNRVVGDSSSRRLCVAMFFRFFFFSHGNGKFTIYVSVDVHLNHIFILYQKKDAELVLFWNCRLQGWHVARKKSSGW